MLTRERFGAFAQLPFNSVSVKRARTIETRVNHSGAHASVSSAHNKPECQHRPIKAESFVSSIKARTGASCLERLFSIAAKNSPGRSFRQLR